MASRTVFMYSGDFMRSLKSSLLPSTPHLKDLLRNNGILRGHRRPRGTKAVSESWFSPSMPDQYQSIDGYTVYSKCRTTRRGGGVAVYVRDSIPSSTISDVTVPQNLECLWVKVRPYRLPRHLSSIALCCLYSPPQSPYGEELVDHLIATSDYLRTTHPGIGLAFLCDFNHLNVRDILLDKDLSQVVLGNTRGNAMLDLIITNMKSYFKTPAIHPPIGLSDHNTILWEPNVKLKQNSCTRKLTRPMREPNLSHFGKWITTHSWNEVYAATTTQEKADAFYSTLTSAIAKFFPTKSVKLHPSDKPWITPRIKHLIKQRQRTFTPGIPTVMSRFYRYKVQREIRKAKKTFYTIDVEGHKKNNPRSWHNGLKAICNMNKKASRIYAPGVDQNDHTAIANAINVKFATVSQSLPPLQLSSLPSFLPAQPVPTIHVWDVYSQLQSTNTYKSPGPDGIPARILKEFACELSTPLCDLFNTSFTEGTVPSQWKEANVVPLPKSSPPSIDELRPISLTPMLSKLCERFVTNWIVNDISPRLDPRQFGGRKQRSTTHALVSLVDFLYKSSSLPSSICTLVTTDLSKAFDKVDHTIAVRSLLDIGVRPSVIPWICSFMTDRRQRVSYQGSTSDWLHLSCGVAQGTLLGPVIFTALIDAALREEANRWKYVDDMNIAETRLIRQPCALQPKLDGLNSWVCDHKMALNPKKCKVLQVCFARTPPPPEPLFISGHALESVTYIKVLGTTIQSDLKWDRQVDNMVKSSNRRLFMLRRLKRCGVSTPDLTTVYAMICLPTSKFLPGQDYFPIKGEREGEREGGREGGRIERGGGMEGEREGPEIGGGMEGERGGTIERGGGIERGDRREGGGIERGEERGGPERGGWMEGERGGPGIGGGMEGERGGPGIGGGMEGERGGSGIGGGMEGERGGSGIGGGMEGERGGSGIGGGMEG
ncbi:Hypp2194 [Branchiostoma lanceolatum]|uniref:Hypp2194 protein n=1 Tax=Branchiostoma lanceolatum TaxID=7740 RepID=A0A8J9ZTG7_BRALA|nr:Hypp2194 [Branchiostoma lanceolatum]